MPRSGLIRACVSPLPAGSASGRVLSLFLSILLSVAHLDIRLVVLSEGEYNIEDDVRNGGNNRVLLPLSVIQCCKKAMFVSQDPVEIEKHLIAKLRLLVKIDNGQADVEQWGEENLSIASNAVRGLSPQERNGLTSCSASRSATYSFSLLITSNITLWRLTSFSGSEARASSGTSRWYSSSSSRSWFSWNLRIGSGSWLQKLGCEYRPYTTGL